MTSKRILILVPGENARGGITNYYQSIRKHLPSNIYYFKRGARNWPNHSTKFIEALRVIKDYIRFIFYIIKKRIEIIQTSTSLGRSALIRDGIFIILSKILNKKVIVFFRGWNPKYEFLLNKGFILRKIFYSADTIIVLNSYVKDFLNDNGYEKNIFLETTLVDINILDGIDESTIIQKLNSVVNINILFLARIEKEKGIFEALTTFCELKKIEPTLKFYIAGDGSCEVELRNRIISEDIKDVILMGHINGTKKVNIFKQSHIYFFPSYTEGMPNSVLEAMGFGLPVIAHNVGGLRDIFNNGINGFATDSLNPKEYVKLFCKLLNERQTLLEISLNNYKYAKQKFTSDIVAERLLNIFRKY